MTDRHELQRPDGIQNSPSDNDTGAMEKPHILDSVNETSNSQLGRLLCLLGWHDYKVIDATYGFGPGGNVERVECQRCGRMNSRWC
jgi:hypothetical protein